MMFLLAAAAAQAVLVDNFESYIPGDITSPWVVTDGAPTFGEEAGGNRYTESYGSYLSLGGSAIGADDTETTVFYRVYELEGTDPDCSIGLSNLADPQGDWTDFESYVVLINGNLQARNGSGNTTIITGISEATWYNIWLVINNSANTYDVYVTTGTADATAGDLKADDYVFRKSTSDALVTFKIYGRSDAPVRVDDIYITGGTDLSIPSESLTPPVIVSEPDDVTVNETQEASFQTVFTSQTDPSAQWYKVASPEDLFMDPAEADIDVQLSYDELTEQYTSALSITGLSSSDAGQYYCRVNNDSGSPRNSAEATLTVLGLVARWTMDQEDYSGGLLLDVVGGYDAAPAGTPVFVEGADGTADGAVQITSDSGWAQVEEFDPALGSGLLTLSVWVNWKETAVSSQALQMDAYPDESSLEADNGLQADDQWQHLCVVYTGTAAQIYIDGLLKAEGPWTLPADTSAALNIGSAAGGGESFNGYLDDLRIYNYAMADTDVAELYYQVSGQGVCLPAFLDPYDFSGPEGQPDCRVDLYDLAVFTGQWLVLYDFEEFADFSGSWQSSSLYPN